MTVDDSVMKHTANMRQWAHQTWSPSRNYTPLWGTWHSDPVINVFIYGYLHEVN